MQQSARIDDAVASLNVLDARDPAAMDEYPIVTLAFFHVEALFQNYGREEALTAARDYLERLRYAERRTTREALRSAIEQLTIFVTTGDWRPSKGLKPLH